MAALGSLRLDNLPPWALYGGAGVVAGGGYLLYKKRHAAADGAAAPSTAMSDLSAYSSPASASGQQPSIVPYYLTADQQNPGGSATMTQRKPPKTTPARIPPATGVSTPATLPDLPPILPVSPTPAPQVAPGQPAPTAAPGPANLPGDLLAKIKANGESLIGSLIDPETGGTWWFSDKGGVYAVNGARFLGSVPGVGAYFPGFKAIQAVPLGKGYRIVNSAGQTYNFGA